jgi:hypothetical protein
MRLLSASDDLREVITDLIAADMSAELVRQGADLTCDRSIIFTLHAAGFGPRSIAELMNEARSLAACSMPVPVSLRLMELAH